jgi:hypothetical protein
MLFPRTGLQDLRPHAKPIIQLEAIPYMQEIYLGEHLQYGNASAKHQDCSSQIQLQAIQNPEAWQHHGEVD